MHHQFRRFPITPKTTKFEETDPIYLALISAQKQQFQQLYGYHRYKIPKEFCEVFITAPSITTMHKYFHKVSLRDSSGKTLLFYAVAGGIHLGYKQNFEILRPLVTIQDQYGMTSLMLAAYMGHFDIKVLIPYEAGFRDKQGRSALFYAVIGRRTDTVLELLKYEFETVDFQGRDVYDYFRKYGLDVEILREYGVERQHRKIAHQNVNRNSRVPQ